MPQFIPISVYGKIGGIALNAIKNRNTCERVRLVSTCVAQTKTAENQPTEYGYLFPISYGRMCLNCSNQSDARPSEKKTGCPKCGANRGDGLEYIRIEDNGRTLGVDHSPLLAHINSENTNVFSTLDPQPPEHHPFWAQTRSWLIDTLSGSRWEHRTENTGVVVPFTEDSEVDINEVDVWFDAVCDYVNNGRTEIACIAEVDNQRVATWSRRIAKGAGMTQPIGDYCALISGLYWVSETVTVLREIVGQDGVPNVTVSGDSNIIDYHHTSNPISDTRLLPLHHLVEEAIDGMNISLNRVKTTDNRRIGSTIGHTCPSPAHIVE